MAITFGNASFDTDQASGTTSANCNGDFFLVAVNSTSNNITAMTYNGATMTQFGPAVFTTWSGRYHYVFYITNPSQGANNVVTTGGANWQFIWFSASGVDQTTPLNSESDSGDQSSANPTASVTTTVNNAHSIAIGQIGGSSPTAGSGTSLIVEGVGGAFFVFRSTSAVSPAGSSTLNITAGAAGWRLRGLALNPPVSTSFVPQLMSLRVG